MFTAEINEFVHSVNGVTVNNQVLLSGPAPVFWTFALPMRCTSLLRVVVSEMTYTVSSGTLNSTLLYHTIKFR